MSRFSEAAKNVAYHVRHTVPALRGPVRHQDTYIGMRELAEASWQLSRVLRDFPDKYGTSLDSVQLPPRTREQVYQLADANRRAVAKQLQAARQLQELCQVYEQTLNARALDKTHRVDGKE